MRPLRARVSGQGRNLASRRCSRRMARKRKSPVVHEPCVGCGVCEMICPVEPAAIEIVPRAGLEEIMSENVLKRRFREQIMVMFGREPKKPAIIAPEAQNDPSLQARQPRSDCRKTACPRPCHPRQQVAQPALGDADHRQPAVHDLVLFRRPDPRGCADCLALRRLPPDRPQLGAAGDAGAQAHHQQPASSAPVRSCSCGCCSAGAPSAPGSVLTICWPSGRRSSTSTW